MSSLAIERSSCPPTSSNNRSVINSLLNASSTKRTVSIGAALTDLNVGGSGGGGGGGGSGACGGAGGSGITGAAGIEAEGPGPDEDTVVVPKLPRLKVGDGNVAGTVYCWVGPVGLGPGLGDGVGVDAFELEEDDF